MGLKRDLYQTLIRSVLVYGLDTGVISATQMARLESFQTRALRWLAKTPSHLQHETSADLRMRLGVPTVESHLRRCRLKWLRDSLASPEEHLQVLTSLFGSLPWHRKRLTWEETPMLRCLRADLLALGSFTAETLTGIPTPETLQAIARLGDADFDTCFGFPEYL